jgi:hypothetical protein
MHIVGIGGFVQIVNSALQKYGYGHPSPVSRRIGVDRLKICRRREHELDLMTPDIVISPCGSVGSAFHSHSKFSRLETLDAA